MRRLDGNIRSRGSHGDANVGLGQSGGIVYAVSSFLNMGSRTRSNVRNPARDGGTNHGRSTAPDSDCMPQAPTSKEPLQ